MRFVLVIFKSVLHVVLCGRYGGVVMCHSYYEEKGGGVLFESRRWFLVWEDIIVLVKGQTGGFSIYGRSPILVFQRHQSSTLLQF